MNGITLCEGCGNEIIDCKNKGCWFAKCKGFVHKDGGFHCCIGKNFVAIPKGEI